MHEDEIHEREQWGISKDGFWAGGNFEDHPDQKSKFSMRRYQKMKNHGKLSKLTSYKHPSTQRTIDIHKINVGSTDQAPLNQIDRSLFSTLKVGDDADRLPLVSTRTSRMLRQNSKSIGGMSSERKSHFSHYCYDNIQMNVAPEVAQKILMPRPLKANQSALGHFTKGPNLGSAALQDSLRLNLDKVRFQSVTP